MDAPNKEILRTIDKPLFEDYWERFLQSLTYCKEKKYRTTIRLTIVKGLNDIEPENYAKLILQADPDFIEVKGYMHVGESQKVLYPSHMPTHKEVKAFALKVLEYLPDYECSSEHQPSNVTLLAKKIYQKKTWIDFNKFFELVNKEPYPENLDALEYATRREQVKESAIKETNL